MNAATLDDLRPRAPGGLPGATLLALMAHGLLLVALSLGVNWRSAEPPAIEAELWAAVPQAAAPRAVQPEPPTPAPRPAPTPKVEEPPPPNRDAEIARERLEEKAKLEKQRLDEERRQEAERRKQQEQAKAEAERKEKLAAAQKEAQIAKLREENLRRITGEAGATGSADSTGKAAQSAGPSATYAGRIKARIRPNIVFGDELSSNPLASVEVKLAPDGTIIGRRLTRSSGIAAWDEAVLRAIDKTEVLPRDVDGRVPPSIPIDFRPHE